VFAKQITSENDKGLQTKRNARVKSIIGFVVVAQFTILKQCSKEMFVVNVTIANAKLNGYTSEENKNCKYIVQW
jgi:hypothetical protein